MDDVFKRLDEWLKLHRGDPVAADVRAILAAADRLNKRVEALQIEVTGLQAEIQSMRTRFNLRSGM